MKAISQPQWPSGSPWADALLRLALSRMSPAGARARLSIAIFHRVLPQPDPLFPGEVDRTQFDAICGWLRNWFNVLPLDEAAERLKAGSLPARALCITFDDGYADNHDVALPVLRQHGLPATFFIATGFLDGGRMWNDTVIECVRGHPAGVLDLTSLAVPGVGPVQLDDTVSRRAAIAQLLPRLKHLPPARRDAAVARIAELAGVQLPQHLMMTSQQVKGLADAGMQIGAHTLSHPILATLDASAAQLEITQSKGRLQDLLTAPVTLFAYPNGKPGSDYLPRDVHLAQAAGFKAAVSTSPGAARNGTQLFELPRFTPWDQSRWTFGARMLRNFGSRTSAAAG